MGSDRKAFLLTMLLGAVLTFLAVFALAVCSQPRV